MHSKETAGGLCSTPGCIRAVEIRCDACNQRSHRAAERAGFRLEAELRWDDRAYDGSLSDTAIYVPLAEDFPFDSVSQGAFVS